MRARLRATRACLAFALALPLAAAGAGSALAAPPEWEQAAMQVAAPWPALQGRDGHFADYVVSRAPSAERDDYGDAMLGYGLLQTAARTGDGRLRDAGFAAIAHAVKSPGRKAVSAFRYMALASAYNLARERFAGDRAFAAARPAWEAALKKVKVLRVGRAPVTNKSLVEGVEILELARSGLSSSEAGTVLHDPAAAVALVRRLLASQLPRAARRFERSAGAAGRGAILGDYPGLPLAYHALAAGFLTRAVELMGDSAPAQARKLLGRAVAASWALAAPDGDLAYIGRSQEQSWALPLTAYAVEHRFPGLASRAVARLAGAYTTGPEGFLTTPALGHGLRAAIAGLDPYAAGVSYAGLTLVGLEWGMPAARVASGPVEPTGPLVMGAGAASFATVHRGDLWFAVKRAVSAPADLRYDFGLIAMERNGTSMPLRPRSERGGDSAGPILRVGRRAGLPEGRRMSVARDGTVTVVGGYRAASGRWLRRGIRFRFAPTACGVRLTAPARRGDRYELSAFFRGSPRIARGSARDGTQRVSFSRRGRARRVGGGASGADAHLTRVRIALERVRRLEVTTCVG